MDCTTCGLPLPLRRAEPGKRYELWQCTNCGELVRGTSDPQARPAIRANCLPAFTGPPVSKTEPLEEG